MNTPAATRVVLCMIQRTARYVRSSDVCTATRRCRSSPDNGTLRSPSTKFKPLSSALRSPRCRHAKGVAEPVFSRHNSILSYRYGPQHIITPSKHRLARHRRIFRDRRKQEDEKAVSSFPLDDLSSGTCCYAYPLTVLCLGSHTKTCSTIQSINIRVALPSAQSISDGGERGQQDISLPV